MAGDWLKWTKGLVNKREVVIIAAHCNISQDEAASKCMRAWEWADDNTTDGNAPGVTSSFLDRYIGEPHFAEAMQKAGWLVVENGHLSFPKFDRHNSKSAKDRALCAERVKRSRNGASVTKALPEKRREEKILEHAGACSSEPPPGEEQAARKRTPRDDLWDAVAAHWFGGKVAKPQKPRAGGIVENLTQLEATPDELRKRIGRYKAEWPKAECTPEAIVKHWARFDGRGGVARRPAAGPEHSQTHLLPHQVPIPPQESEAVEAKRKHMSQIVRELKGAAK